MFQKLFTNARTIARYRDGPMSETRLLNFVHCESADTRPGPACSARSPATRGTSSASSTRVPG